MRKVSFNTQSEDQNDFCEECLDTGFGGDNGPGWSSNNEVLPCSCDPQKRAKRVLARKEVPEL